VNKNIKMGKNNNPIVINVGDKIGEFIVIRDEYIGKNRTWICLCKCGGEKRFWKPSMIGRQKTCGCGMDDAGFTAKQRRSMTSRMNGYKAGAKKRKLEWGLSYFEFARVASGKCFYCNAEPKIWDCVSGAPSVRKDCPNINPEEYKIKFNGVDRLNSDIGYVSDNVVSCCVKCNRAKSDLTIEEFRNLIERIYTWLFQKE
jgi:hypothetical protein